MLRIATTVPAALGAEPPPHLVADTNCDLVGSAADFVAAVTVSGDPEAFPGCTDADPYRGRELSDLDFVPILHDVFGTLNPLFTPTPTASGGASPTRSATPSPTVTPPPSRTATHTPSVSATPSQTSTPSATPTPTATRTRTRTFTPSATPTPTPTRTTPPTRTPTGLAYQLSGDWAANWQNQICYLAGVPFDALADTVYRVTADSGQLDIRDLNSGAYIGRGLEVSPQGQVEFRYRRSGLLCELTGVIQEYIFDFVFVFQLNGQGTATSRWTYGYNTNCAVCTVDDSASLRRVGLP